MVTAGDNSEAEHLRAQLRCTLADDYPEFSGLADILPDDLLTPLSLYLNISPSINLLRFCSSTYVQSNPDAAETRVRNIFSALPDANSLLSGTEGVAGLRRRSATVSLAVAVIEELASKGLGSIMDTKWNQWVISWVRSAVRFACELPDLWHEASPQHHLRIYMALATNHSKVESLVDFCRSRGSIDPDLVKGFLENESAPLGDGTL